MRSCVHGVQPCDAEEDGSQGCDPSDRGGFPEYEDPDDPHPDRADRHPDGVGRAAYLQTLHGLAVQARDGCSRETVHAIIDQAMRSWEHVAESPSTS